MASALPSHPPLDDNEHDRNGTDAEPLLGARGDVSAQQPPAKPILYNVITGTALLAQAGIWILIAAIWAGILYNPLMLFSAHPLLNSGALLFSIEAVLLLQPTHTAQQKRVGAALHGSLNLAAFLAFAAALIVIEVNKGKNPPHPRFSSVHGILGLITYILLLIQTSVGFTMYWTPALYGSVNRAKGVWKYHRLSGYLVVTTGLATICAATQTDFNVNALHLKLWVVLVCAVLVLAGLLPRLRLAKLGLAK